MRLRGFGRHCVSNLKSPVKQAHRPEIGDIKPPPKLCGQPARQFLEHSFSVRCPLPAALLMLDDQPANLPVTLHHGGVDRAIGGRARLLQHRAHLTVQLGDGEGHSLALLYHGGRSIRPQYDPKRCRPSPFHCMANHSNAALRSRRYREVASSKNN
jgi:hypothetical protein